MKTQQLGLTGPDILCLFNSFKLVASWISIISMQGIKSLNTVTPMILEVTENAIQIVKITDIKGATAITIQSL